jgi:hypothetical protein
MGGRFAAFAGATADVKEKVKLNRFTRNWQSLFVCEFDLSCKHMANGSCCYDFTEGAEWHRISQETYMLSTVGEERSPWAQVTSWSIFMNLFDLLHLLYLGVGKDVAGQLIWEFAAMYHTELNLNDAVREVGKDCERFYRGLGSPIPVNNWDLGFISWESNSDYPRLCSKVKGSKTKIILMYCCHRAIEIVNSGRDTSGFARVRARMAWGLLKFIRTCDSSGLWMSPNDAQAAGDAGLLFLRSYMELVAYAASKEWVAYKVRPKLHYLWHVITDLPRKRLNPRRIDLFGSEDMIGKVKQIAKSCHRSSALYYTCLKWIMLWATRWNRVLQERHREDVLSRHGSSKNKLAMCLQFKYN